MAVNIVSISPITGAIGVQLHEPVEVIFSTGIDPSSVGIGSFFIEGSDKEVLSGPFNPIQFQNTSLSEVFTDPAYHGLVQGNYTFEYIATDLSALPSNFEDTSGTEEYYTKVTLQPIKPLSPLHPYKVYLSGTSTDTQQIGIASRSVFDTIPDVGNSGNSEIFGHGGYKGLIDGTFTVQLESAGVVGDSTYRWKFNAGSLSPTAITHTHKRHLQDGVSLSFSPEGTFAVGDEFSFLVKPKDYLALINISEFTTGDFGTQVMPTDTNSIVSRVAPPFSGSLQPGFALDHTIPFNVDCDIDENIDSFAFYFNKTLSTNFDTNGMRIYIGPANGDTCIRAETSYTPNHVEVENSTCLRIYLQNT